jgi:hypothetical protein
LHILPRCQSPMINEHTDRHKRVHSHDTPMYMSSHLHLFDCGHNWAAIENAIPLPVSLTKGFVKSVSIQIPWTQLYTEPIKVSEMGGGVGLFYVQNKKIQIKNTNQHNILQGVEIVGEFGAGSTRSTTTTPQPSPQLTSSNPAIAAQLTQAQQNSPAQHPGRIRRLIEWLLKNLRVEVKTCSITLTYVPSQKEQAQGVKVCCVQILWSALFAHPVDGKGQPAVMVRFDCHQIFVVSTY